MKLAPHIPSTSNGHRWWDEMYAIYEQVGVDRFLAWLTEKLQGDDAWVKVVKMMAWNDRNSEYYLDPAIAEKRITRDGDRVEAEDVAKSVLSMLEGMGPA